MKTLLKGSLVASAALPFLAFAQGSETNAFDILGTIMNFVNALIPFAVGLALLFFMYGVIRFILAKDADAKKDARNNVIQGVIGLFAIVSVWGLVGLIQSTFGIGAGGTVGANEIPGVQF